MSDDEYYYDDADMNYEQEDYSQGIGQNTDEYEFIQSDEVEAKRDELIKNFIELSSLTYDEAELVLINYNWNLDKLQTDWYDKIQKIKIDSGIIRSNESIKKTKKAENQSCCPICFEELNSSNKIGLKCNHFICRDCFKDYLINKIKEDPLTCVSTNCPQKECSLIIPSSLFKKVLSNTNKEKEYYKTFYKYLLKNFTDSNSDIKWCPNTLCGQCIRLPGHGMKDIRCVCNTVFCFKCLRLTHRPCDCEMMDIWEKKHKNSSEDIKWIIENTKQCPKCGKFIQKNQGCNHMTCKCGHNFCWICMGNWDIHNNSYYKCIFQDKKDGYKTMKGEGKNEGVKESERFVHFCEMYENHNSGIKIAKTEKEKVPEYIETLFNEKKVEYSKMDFIKESFDIVITARQTLMSTYVYRYFLKDSEKKNNIQLFEHHQFLLDKQTDLLHELLEKDLTQLISDTSNAKFYKEFEDLRKKCIDRESIIKNYQENLLKEIENNMGRVFENSRYKING